MGQKVHPKGLRLGIIKTWESRWFATAGFAYCVCEDAFLRKIIKEKLKEAAVSRVEIERKINKSNLGGGKVTLTIHSAKPAMVIGRTGQEVEKLTKFILKELTAWHLKNKREVNLDANDFYIKVAEIRKPELDAQLVSENIAMQLEKRISFRRAMKQAIQKAMRAGAEGIKVQCAGRLAGAEIARTEWAKEGKIPLQTLRADIDYGFAESYTTYGRIGVKVWIYKGEIFTKKEVSNVTTQENKI